MQQLRTRRTCVVATACFSTLFALAGCGGAEADPDPVDTGGGNDSGTIRLDLYVTKSPRVQPGDVVDLVRLVEVEGTDGVVVPAVEVVSTDFDDDGELAKGNVVLRMEERWVGRLDAMDSSEGNGELTLRVRDEPAD